jgi:hypothetical protein
LKKGAPKGRGSKSATKGTGDDRVPLKIVTSATPPAATAMGETGTVIGENHRHARPSTLPFSRSTPDFLDMFQPGPVHLQGQEVSHTPPPGVNDSFDLPDNWDMSPSMRPAPLGMAGYSVSSGVDGAGLFTSGIGRGSFEDYQAPINTQSHIRRAGVAEDPNQRAVQTYGAYGARSFNQDSQALPNMQSQLHRGEASGNSNQRAATAYDVYGASNLSQGIHALPNMQSQLHRVDVAGNSDQRATAAQGTYGAAPIGGPTQHSQSLVSGPKDHTRKRPRID